MSDSNIYLIITHLLAFALGAGCMKLFYFLLGRNRRHSNSRYPHEHRDTESIPNNNSKSNKKENNKSVTIGTTEIVGTINKEDSGSKEKKPSNEEIHNQQRQAEKARKRQEEIDRKAALAEAKRKQAFNPRISKPENLIYTNLSVSDGKLVLCSAGQTPYYHYWECEGRYFYEFFCDPSKVAKAVNNRSVIIDPFCLKKSDSVAVNESKSVIINEFGELDSNLKIISKSIITYQ